MDVEPVRHHLLTLWDHAKHHVLTFWEEVEISLLLGILGILAYVWLYWRSGGRDAYNESAEDKKARWSSLFQNMDDGDVAKELVQPSDKPEIMRLSQKCGLTLRTLLNDTALDLSHKALDDSDGFGLAALLRSHPTLEQLDLSHNELGSTAIEAMVKAGSKAAQLTSLNVMHNSLSDESAGVALGEFACQCPALRELHAGQNYLRDGGGRAIAAALREPECGLQRLTMPQCHLGDETAYALGAALQVCTLLKRLSLWGNEHMTAAAQKQLRKAWGEDRGHLMLDDDE